MGAVRAAIVVIVALIPEKYRARAVAVATAAALVLALASGLANEFLSALTGQ